jgi:hypothetical protein
MNPPVRMPPGAAPPCSCLSGRGGSPDVLQVLISPLQNDHPREFGGAHFLPDHGKESLTVQVCVLHPGGETDETLAFLMVYIFPGEITGICKLAAQTVFPAQDTASLPVSL